MKKWFAPAALVATLTFLPAQAQENNATQPAPVQVAPSTQTADSYNGRYDTTSAVGPTCRRVTTTVTRTVCGPEVQTAPPVRAKRAVKAKRYAAPPRPPVYRERIERPRYVHRPPPSQGRWEYFPHPDSMGVFPRGSILRGQVRYGYYNGQQIRCRGGSLDTGAHRQCEIRRR